MSETSRQRSEQFLKICSQFQLGALTTESSHPLTSALSDAARTNISQGLGELFAVDGDVVRKYRELAASGRLEAIAQVLLQAVKNGGRMFFTGCGSTGRLSIQLVSIWRDFWQRQQQSSGLSLAAKDFENRAFSVMAGGDFALIKSVEGFEDFAAFGKKQLGDLGVCARDVVFAITEGGETSFVIGTAWKGVEAGAKVYFIYNNPDDVLCQHVQRSREVILEPRIEKLNLTTGPMAITGSTRMQATTIQLCALLTVLEMVVRELLKELASEGRTALAVAGHPQHFLSKLEELHKTLASQAFCAHLAELVALEESIYRSKHRNNYFADRFGMDILTDTTERSPTYCTPPFRKFDDSQASESWSFVFVPQTDTPQAWEQLLKRAPACVEWSESEIRSLVSPEQAPRTLEIASRIRCPELVRFKIGADGLKYRTFAHGDSAVVIVSEDEKQSLLSPGGFYRQHLESARHSGASTGLVFLGNAHSISEVREFVRQWDPNCRAVFLEIPVNDFLLDGLTRVGLKVTLNALSTCTMVRLGRVMGNFMVWVVPSNLKLIDRSTRYIQKLTGLAYEAANDLLFEVIEYVEPRMKADQTYPPVVALAVTRNRTGLGNEDAERRLEAGA